MVIHASELFVSGQGWESAVPLSATLLDREGKARGFCSTTPQDNPEAAGAWQCGFTSFGGLLGTTVPPAVFAPGMRVRVDQGSASVTSRPLGRITITGASHGSDRVAGTVPRGVRQVFVRVSEGFMRNRPVPDFEKSAATRRDGSFAVDLTSVGDLMRGDSILAGYRDGIFEVVESALLPAMQVNKDTNALQFLGSGGLPYTLRLRDAAGRLKAETVLNLSREFFRAAAKAPRGFGAGLGFVNFHSATGQPVMIRQGDLIEIAGLGGFRYRVPRFDGLFLDDRLEIRTIRDTAVEVCISNQQLWGACYSRTTDTAGRAVVLHAEMPGPPPAPGAEMTARLVRGGVWLGLTRMIVP